MNLEPYTDAQHRGRYTGITIETDDGDIARILYVSPAQGIVPGQRVERGQTQIGNAQDLHQTHDRRMTNHVHVEFERLYPISPDENGNEANRGPIRMYVDPTPYIRGN